MPQITRLIGGRMGLALSSLSPRSVLFIAELFKMSLSEPAPYRRPRERRGRGRYSASRKSQKASRRQNKQKPKGEIE